MSKSELDILEPSGDVRGRPHGDRIVRAMVISAALGLLIVAGCAGGGPAAPSDSPTAAVDATVEPTPGSAELPAGRLASHLFIPVGESRSIAGLGRLLDTIQLTEPPSVAVEGDTVVATSGGLSCLRFQYREVAGENEVQTLCALSFDETGDCTGLEPVSLDLNMFLDAPEETAGNANLLESGDGLFYAVCRTTTGVYRLQRPDRPLPPLYFTIVDALGDGAYSLGDSEMPAQRAGAVTASSGDEVRPPWILAVTREISELAVTADGSVEINDEDCNLTPSCTYLADAVRAGDVVRISSGISSELLTAALAESPEAVRDRFFSERTGLAWSEITAVHPDAAAAAFARLVSLDVMGELLPYFDGIYDLRGKGVAIGYWPFWQATRSVVPACFPDDIVPGEQSRCRTIEAAIQAEEARRIGEWRAEGYDLWYAGFIDYGEGGEYASMSDLRPHFSLFGGIVAGVGANSSVRVPDVPATLAEAVRLFAAEIDPGMPVVLALNGPPISAVTGGEFCEADICPSDFKGMYDQSEAVLDSALSSLAPEQFQGFGVAMFEGSQFDIRAPHEAFGGYSLNRVGETGYNNPVLNIYRAR